MTNAGSRRVGVSTSLAGPAILASIVSELQLLWPLVLTLALRWLLTVTDVLPGIRLRFLVVPSLWVLLHTHVLGPLVEVIGLMLAVATMV